MVGIILFVHSWLKAISLNKLPYPRNPFAQNRRINKYNTKNTGYDEEFEQVVQEQEVAFGLGRPQFLQKEEHNHEPKVKIGVHIAHIIY